MTTATQTQVVPNIVPPVAPVAPVAKPIQLGRFEGAFGGFQRALWHTLKAFGFQSMVAHKIAIDFGSDLGRAMRADATVNAEVSKANKNNESYLKLSGKSVRVANSPAMEYSRLCTLIEKAYDEKLLLKRSFPGPEVLPVRMTEYMAETVKWTEDKTFVD